MNYVVEFIKALPAIVQFLIVLKRWVDMESRIEERKKILNNVTEKINDAIKNKNTSDVEHLFDGNGD